MFVYLYACLVSCTLPIYSLIWMVVVFGWMFPTTFDITLFCLQVKKDYVDGLSDSLDLVVIGAWWGNGRKAGWFSPFLLACYDEETETYQSVCKVMSGFTDEFYKQTTAMFQERHVIAAKRTYYDVSDSMWPSVWFEPVHVWEIKGADFTVSPVHTAARGAISEKPNAGISLRFPRFIRQREDKTPEEATTSAQISELYRLQFEPRVKDTPRGDSDGAGDKGSGKAATHLQTGRLGDEDERTDDEDEEMYTEKEGKSRASGHLLDDDDAEEVDEDVDDDIE
eukprot:m.188366 g.188366  ORF g.188366 m.188366 type:complete len:281 (+) comp16723_c0_seq5:65-907(+)